MEKIIERNVPIAEENVTLSGQPATNMFEDWSENITETDLLHEEKDKGLPPDSLYFGRILRIVFIF